MEISLFILFVLTEAVAGLWNNLNCPAPRSPENGLSFIFRNGELVHFRCHPGYVMMGKAVAYCVNNHWTAPAPECIRIRKGSRRIPARPSNLAVHDDSNYYSHQQGSRNETSPPTREELNRELFNWDNKSRRKSVYGDGPRRVPLINGIWPGNDVQIMALGPQTTPGPMELIREEVNIAELRQQQYEEVKKQRHLNPGLDSRKRRKNRKRKNKHRNSVTNNDVDDYKRRETVISLGTTQDGKALSISHVRPSNDSNQMDNNLHKYRHRDPNKKRKGKKWRNRYPQSGNVIARSSRVDTSGLPPDNFRRHKSRSRYHKNEVAEFRRLPVEHVGDVKTTTTTSSAYAEYDTSCVESFYGRDVPMIAPQVTNAFVYRYETKKNKEFPFNSYMQVKYRCLNGYVFSDSRIQVLNCRQASWVGEVPRCVPKAG